MTKRFFYLPTVLLCSIFLNCCDGSFDKHPPQLNTVPITLLDRKPNTEIRGIEWFPAQNLLFLAVSTFGTTNNGLSNIEHDILTYIPGGTFEAYEAFVSDNGFRRKINDIAIQPTDTLTDFNRHFVAASSGRRTVYQANFNEELKILMAAAPSDHPSFNIAPEYLAVSSAGIVYFTGAQPRSLNRYFRMISPSGELIEVSLGGIQHPGQLLLLEEEDKLYVVNILNSAVGTGLQNYDIWLYELDEQGYPRNGKIVITTEEMITGLAVDNSGNFLISHLSSLHIRDPDGILTSITTIDGRPSDIAIGGPNLNTLFITTIDGKLFSVALDGNNRH